VSSIIALAKAGIECCRSAQVYQTEAARIGKRLTVIVARAHEWSRLDRTGKTHSIQNFHEAVENVYFCLQAASRVRSGSWKARALAKLGSTDLLSAIKDAEKQLNAVIVDLHLEQSNAIFARLDDLKDGVAAVLDLFGKGALSIITSHNVRKKTILEQVEERSKTIQKQVDTVLMEYQREAPELVISSGTDGTDDLSVLDSAEGIAAPKVVFHPSSTEIKKIELNRSKLIFIDNKASFLGGGGFADVYLGTYIGKPVAIKRLKASARDFASLSKKQIQEDIARLSSEALMMYRCSMHPNITAVIGCVTSFDSIERPLIVMELMTTTLFDVLHKHQKQTQFSYAHALYLMKGVAGALEFLHLQGIVHHDVKSVSTSVLCWLAYIRGLTLLRWSHHYS